MKERDKWVLLAIALFFLLRKKDGLSPTAPAADASPGPVTSPSQVQAKNPSSIEVRSTDRNPSGPPASASFDATSDDGGS